MKNQLVMGLNLKRSVSHQFVNDGRGCVPRKGSNARVSPRVCTNRVVKFPGATQKDTKIRRNHFVRGLLQNQMGFQTSIVEGQRRRATRDGDGFAHRERDRDGLVDANVSLAEPGRDAEETIATQVRAIDGYDNATHEYFSTWIDNFGTGVMVFRGTCEDPCKSLTETAEGFDPMAGKVMKTKEVTTFLDPDTYRFEMFMVGAAPDGKDVKVTGCVMHSEGLGTDGQHFDGPANDITIQDCDFKTGDDSIALNAPEGYSGNISRVSVTGCTFDSWSLMRIYTTFGSSIPN